MKDDFRDRSHLTSIEGDRPADTPRAGRRTALDQDEQVTCWQCELDTGIATSMVTEVTLAPRRSPAGKKVGGTKAWVCAHCMARGKVTRLL
ncbi:hypothetical protein [Paradevosia shaoguanensis]|uniref:hypothetical protein n=1 Tax=Paradevosia shaoguanensis TaxID=1335043 RepID=UPI001932B454|nr:hypothetical protein [Paradevosia shaoguanensis]